jgi:RNA polymerase sigma-70 factor (ECF subfamily)
MPGASDSQTGSTLWVLVHSPEDPDAWKAFVRRYAPKLVAWCQHWKLQPADAEDVTQEVLYRLARHMRRLRYDPTKGRFRTWLKTLARHAWIDLRHSRRRAGWGTGDPNIQRLLDEREDPGEVAEVLDEEFMRDVYEEAKARVQLRVSRTTWQAFRLLGLEGKPGVEVAARLKMSVAAAYMAKSRVLQMLRGEVEQLSG